MSQGWRLPDGTPCGRKMPDDMVSSSGSTAAVGTSNTTTMLSTGFCYNGQCRPFNCHGEMFYRTASSSPASSNVYSGAGALNETIHDHQHHHEEVDCSSGPSTGLAIPGFDLPLEKEDEDIAPGVADYDSSYRLVRIRPKG